MEKNWRNKFQNSNKIIAMLPCTKSELILRIPDFCPNLSKKMKDKNFGKINVNIAITI